MGSFVPLAQATRQEPIALTASVGAKDVMGANGRYDIDRDPLWNGEAEASTGTGLTKEEIAYYQVDHLGTPQELTDHEGNIAWAAQYKAWGETREVISDAARKAGIANPIRFQGQYYDEETGLHYNRHRYYDPNTGRFVSSDPIGLRGDTNLHRYAPNPTEWIDALGLTPGCPHKLSDDLYFYNPQLKKAHVQEYEKIASVEIRVGSLDGGFWLATGVKGGRSPAQRTLDAGRRPVRCRYGQCGKMTHWP